MEPREACIDYTALRNQSRSSSGYDFSFGPSLAKVGRLGSENYASHRQTLHYVNLYIDITIIFLSFVAQTKLSHSLQVENFSDDNCRTPHCCVNR